MVSVGELANFSCTLNVTTGNEILQFAVFDIVFNDRHRACKVDKSTYAVRTCLWPDYGINMTCDYSVPYQITCGLILSGLTESISTQVICFSGPEVVPSTATLAVRGKRSTIFVMYFNFWLTLCKRKCCLYPPTNSVTSLLVQACCTCSIA